ncbi:homeobox protein Mohawk-like [Diadema antillarum]|uniref:homeobox protein Mohawk-like n=1 Tax=Diadema antillarum TaxID=105358 RepID=UPI003A863393
METNLQATGTNSFAPSMDRRMKEQVFCGVASPEDRCGAGPVGVELGLTVGVQSASMGGDVASSSVRDLLAAAPSNNGGNNDSTTYRADSCGTYRQHNLRLRNRLNRLYPSLMSNRARRKRQTMQDMTKPLKQWLYNHRDYPYPNKREKLLLSLNSKMTLVQVSNWFANARRRMKNTVGRPWLTWEQRIRQYDNHVTGNAERLSVSSRETATEDDFHPMLDTGYANVILDNDDDVRDDEDSRGTRTTWTHNSSATDGKHSLATTHKFKNTILQRYLNDSYEHARNLQNDAHCPAPSESARNAHPSPTTDNLSDAEITAGQCRGQRVKFTALDSVGSNEYEYLSSSPDSTSSISCLSSRQRHSSEEYSLASSSDDWTSFLKDVKNPEFKCKEDEETYWQEIVAAVALTNMARSRHRGK